MRRLWWLLPFLGVAVTAPLVALLDTGRGGAIRVSFRPITPNMLPHDLAAWKETRPEVPTMLVRDVGPYTYFLVSMGHCSPPGRPFRVKGVAKVGGGPSVLWVTGEFPEGQAAEPGTPVALFRVRTSDIDNASPKGMTVQEEQMLPIRLLPQEPEGEQPVRRYLPAEGYQCRELIR